MKSFERGMTIGPFGHFGSSNVETTIIKASARTERERQEVVKPDRLKAKYGPKVARVLGGESYACPFLFSSQEYFYPTVLQSRNMYNTLLLRVSSIPRAPLLSSLSSLFLYLPISALLVLFLFGFSVV